MNIQTLPETEKELAIRAIIARGLVTPGGRLRKLAGLWRACAFRTLFFGAGDCLALGLLLAACLWGLLAQADPRLLACLAFAVSPFAYTASHLLTVWKEHMTQLYEMKMTCRYTIRQVGALRMVYFSGLNLLLNTASLSVLSRFCFPGAALWRLLGLSFTAVFLYGILLLLCQLFLRPGLRAAAPPLLWGAACTLLLGRYGVRAERFLLSLPGLVVAAAALVSLLIYLAALSACLLHIPENREEEPYAVG